MDRQFMDGNSGQRSDPVTITVTDKDLILEIPALPVFGDSPESRLRVRDPPTTSDPPQTTALHTPASTAFSNTGLPASSSPLPPFYSSFIVPIIAVVGSLVLMVLVVVGLVQLWRKQRETQSAGPGPGLRRLPAGWTSLSLLCCLTVLPAAGECVPVLLLSALTVSAGETKPKPTVRQMEPTPALCAGEGDDLSLTTVQPQVQGQLL
ncbi:hypothetical protein Q5P01_000561 [Channa striata]|uniref:Uncharacterized protein n=1 Tax=Channa striata TaxID=64152 RepID=A0AA88IG96_CHASR|nr:hypothetical protein Q5P01_000561 [Channa striata]